MTKPSICTYLEAIKSCKYENAEATDCGFYFSIGNIFNSNKLLRTCKQALRVKNIKKYTTETVKNILRIPLTP